VAAEGGHVVPVDVADEVRGAVALVENVSALARDLDVLHTDTLGHVRAARAGFFVAWLAQLISPEGDGFIALLAECARARLMVAALAEDAVRTLAQVVAFFVVLASGILMVLEAGTAELAVGTVDFFAAALVLALLCANNVSSDIPAPGTVGEL